MFDGRCLTFDVGTGKSDREISWLKDESLEESANLPDPDIIAQGIVEDLQAALAQFAEIANDLKK